MPATEHSQKRGLDKLSFVNYRAARDAPLDIPPALSSCRPLEDGGRRRGQVEGKRVHTVISKLRLRHQRARLAALFGAARMRDLPVPKVLESVLRIAQHSR